MSPFAELSAQVLDKASDCVLGPVQGIVTATSTVDRTTLDRGQLGSLPDGRLVRVIQGARVYIAGTPVRVRLMSLTPTLPANNFAPVLAGTPVTWQTPPTGIVASGTVASDFAQNAAAVLTSFTEIDRMPSDADPYASGGLGSVLAMLVSVDIERASGTVSDRLSRHHIGMARFRIRVNLSSLAHTQRRAASADAVGDALVAAIVGGKVGSAPVMFESWKQVRSSPEYNTYELVISTRFSARGRPFQDANASTQKLNTVGASAIGDEFTVSTDIATP